MDSLSEQTLSALSSASMNIEQLNTTSAPHLDAGKPIFDNSVWLRLPRPGARCPITGLSRSSLAELVRPCPRNDFSPPVEARLLKRRTARRGVLLINRASLLTHIAELPTPESHTQEHIAE